MPPPHIRARNIRDNPTTLLKELNSVPWLTDVYWHIWRGWRGGGGGFFVDNDGLWFFLSCHIERKIEMPQCFFFGQKDSVHFRFRFRFRFLFSSFSKLILSFFSNWCTDEFLSANLSLFFFHYHCLFGF
jgi:hypothetical protein